jgi:hypothetical protein
MPMKPSQLARRACFCALVLGAVAADPAHFLRTGDGIALAQATDAAEKDAFEAAKELGTVEAWDAFLANYPTGFHADLARAYVKKLGEAAPQSPPPQQQAADDFPIAAGTWGGVVRDGAGQGYSKLDSLDEGEPVSLMGRNPVLDNGYPWFKIWYGPEGEKKGYMWGGILCAKGAERPDLYKTCPPEKAKAEPADTEPAKKATKKKAEPAKAPVACASGYVKINGRCIQKGAAAGFCGPGYRPQGGTCVKGYQAPPANTPLSTEQKKAVNKGCPKGQVWNKQEGCHEDD